MYSLLVKQSPNSNKDIFYKEGKGADEVFCLLTGGENPKPKAVSREWLLQHQDEISNLDISSDGKIYPKVMRVSKFIPKDFIVMVRGWWNFYSGNGKTTIGKVLKEEFGDDLIGAYKGLEKMGYDGLIVKNTWVGMYLQPKVFVPNEVIAFYPNQIKSIFNYSPTNSNSIYEKDRQNPRIKIINGVSREQMDFFRNSKIKSKGSLVSCYHSTEEEFDAFDPAFVGGSHGASFGPGFYFSSVPLLQYGKPMECYLNITKPYVIKNLDDLNDVVEFLWYCLKK